MKLEVYTDGSCFENYSIGGWGVYIVSDDQKIQFSGPCNCKSSLYSELVAILKALEYIEYYLYDVETIEIFTDCDFIAKIASQYSSKKKSIYRSKSTLKYKKLLNQVLGYTSIFQIEWHVVKSHRGVEGNEIADNLAKKAALISIKQKMGANPPKFK